MARVDLSVFGFSRLLGNYDGSKAQWVRLPFADVFEILPAFRSWEHLEEAASDVNVRKA
jgi:hypothetical protein